MKSDIVLEQSAKNTPLTFYRRVRIRTICKNHIHILQLKSVKGSFQTFFTNASA